MGDANDVADRGSATQGSAACTCGLRRRLMTQRRTAHMLRALTVDDVGDADDNEHLTVRTANLKHHAPPAHGQRWPVEAVRHRV